MCEVVWFKDLQAHLAHDLVVGALEDPVLETVLASGLAGHEIHVCDRHVRVRITPVRVEMNHDVTRTVRCDFLRQGIGRVSDDLRRCRIVRVELVSRERLDHHERLILTPSALQHRLDLDDGVVGRTEVGSPCSRSRLLGVRRLAVVRVHDRRLFRATHAANSFAIRSNTVVASSRRATAGAAPAHP